MQVLLITSSLFCYQILHLSILIHLLELLIASVPIVEDCSLINKQDNGISISIRPYADYDFPMTQISSTIGDANLETIRNRLESNYIAYSVGVELRARTRSALHLFTGLIEVSLRISLSIP